MTNLHSMQEQRASKIAEMRALGDDLEGRKAERFDALETEVRALDGKIARAAKLAEMERQSESVDHKFEAETRDYSIAKALREGADRLTGREREVHQELSKDRETRGIMVPTSLILGETRAMNTTTGADTIATNLGGMIDRLRPRLAVQQLGATVLSGLSGNLDLPKLTAGPTAHWVAEDVATTPSDSTFDKISLTPRSVSGEMYLSRRLVLQNSVALENVLRSDLAYVLAQALDSAAIRGGGTSEPDGIMEIVAENGTASTALSDVAADLISALELDDVTGSAGFLTHPSVLATARKIKQETGSNRNIPIAETFHQQTVIASNNVPTDGGSPAGYPIIYGAWSNLIVGFWSGIDLLSNPYKDASKGGLWLHAFLDADVNVRHEEGFAWKAV